LLQLSSFTKDCWMSTILVQSYLCRISGISVPWESICSMGVDGRMGDCDKVNLSFNICSADLKTLLNPKICRL